MQIMGHIRFCKDTPNPKEKPREFCANAVFSPLSAPNEKILFSLTWPGPRAFSAGGAS
jgi:hypothetical protein